MNIKTLLTIIVLLIGINSHAIAQALGLTNTPKDHYIETTFCAVTFNGNSIVEHTPKDMPLTIDPSVGGIISLQSYSISNGVKKAQNNVGFKLAIKDFRTSTIYMFSDDVLYEVDNHQIIQRCEMGDTLIFIAIDKKYRIPRHKVIVQAEC